MHGILHFDSLLQCQTGVGFSCGNGGGNVGWEWFIPPCSLLLSPLSWERQYLAVCLRSFDPGLLLLAISGSIRLKSLPHAPSDRRYVTASELHGSQGWELIGHFMAASLYQPLSSEEVSAVIKASLQRENWPKQQCWGGYKDLLLASTSDSFKSQSGYLMLLYSSNITLDFRVLKEVVHKITIKKKNADRTEQSAFCRVYELLFQ